MAYLFDTSMLAEVLRSSPSRPLIRRLTTVPTKDRWTTVVTVTQLLAAARRAQTPRIMQSVVQLVAAVRVAPFDLAAAQTLAKLKASVADELDPDDLTIAAIAITQGFVVVTKRPRAFAAFHQLRVEDWTRPAP